MENLPHNPEHSDKSQVLRDKIDMLGLDYLAYVVKSPYFADATMLALQGPDGQRILIEKVDPFEVAHRKERKTRFFKDTCVSIFPGTMPDAVYEKIEYNYNQYCENELRYREIIGDARVKDVEFGKGQDLARTAMKHWYNHPGALDSMKFEERMGYNNQTATDEQVDQLLEMLDNSTVLDPRNGYAAVE